MKRIFQIGFLIGLACALLLACESDFCLKGGGEEKTLRISFAEFDDMLINGIFNVILIEDTVNFIEFVGGENSLEMIDAVIRDSTLILENSNSCFVRPKQDKITAYVHFKGISTLFIAQSCHVTNEKPISKINMIGLQADMAEIDLVLNKRRFLFYNHHASGGKVTFRGWVGHCTLLVYYATKCDFSELETEESIINNSSIGDLYLNAEEKLTVGIHHSGNVYYSGSPDIIIDTIAGTGQVLKWIEE